MNDAILTKTSYQRKTKQAVLLSSILSEPLFTVYGFVAFILCKDLHATAFQIAILTMLKPIVSIFSFYWSANLSKMGQKLRSNLIGANILGRLPFLFFPWVENPWYVVGASAVYMLFFRAGNPAWIEILKLNLPSDMRQKSFSFGYVLSYLENIALTLAFGAFLDKDPSLWRALFFGSALIGFMNLLLFAKLPINQKEIDAPSATKDSLGQFLLGPWKNSWNLCKKRPDFSLFQWGFMFCGFGIMLLQPAVPLFLVEKLQLSYMDFGIALSLCKGLGIAVSSPLWARLMNKVPIFTMSAYVFSLVGLFPVFLTFAPWHLFWLYLAYTFYGIAQGGSHLLWNLSGPIFSGNQDSSSFSGVNVMMVGIRGAVAPPLGGFLSVVLGPLATILVATGFCFYSSIFLFSKRRIFSFQTSEAVLKSK